MELAVKRSHEAVAAAVLLCSIAVISLYLLRYAIADFTSDAAMNSILARMMYEEGTVFPRHWVISNGEGPFPSTAMLIAPFLAVIPNGFTIHAVFSWLLTVALIGSFYFCVRQIGISRWLSLLGASVFSVGFSYPFVRMTYVETAYFWWPFGFLFCTGCFVIAIEKRCMIYRVLGLFVLFLICLKNPQRTAVMLVLPLLIFVGYFSYSRDARPFMSGWRTLLQSLAGQIALIALAVFTTEYLFKKLGLITDYAVVSGLQLASPTQISNNSKIFLNGWFQYFGAQSEIYADHQFEPMFMAFRSALIVVISAVGLLTIISSFKNGNKLDKALSIAFIVSFCTILGLYIFSTSLAINFLTVRYFTVPFVLLLIIVLRHLDGKIQNARLITVSIFVISIFSMMDGINRLIPCWGGCGPRVSNSAQVADVLQKNGLRFGYGNWWIAGGPTILSRENVFIAPVNVAGTEVIPFPYMMNPEWYDNNHQDREKFLLLLEHEATETLLESVRAKFGGRVREMREAGVVILIFDASVRLF